MAGLEKLLNFRSEKEPLFTLWKFGDHTHYGALIWRGSQPILQLLLETEYEKDFDDEEKSNPFLIKTKPPNKVTMIGNTAEYGPVSIENCMRASWHTARSHSSRSTTHHIDFVPESIWFGTPLDEFDGNVESAVARDIRLGGFFGTPGLERVLPYGEEAREKYEALGSPKEIWLWDGPSEWQIPMGDAGFSLGINTSVSSSSSSTRGYSLQSTVDLHIHADKPTTVERLKKQIFHVEQILSHYSIESFSFLSEEFSDHNGNSATLVWQLGEDADLFTSPMFHQVLANFRDRTAIQTIFDDWFSQSKTVELSRWLFTRSLKETDSGLARFVTVAQAFEVLGREHGPAPKMSKSEHRVRLTKFRSLIESEFDDEFVERASNLISSSNSNSFRDVIAHMIGEAVEYYGLGKKENMESICKNLSDLRNTIVHMSDNNEGKLNESFSAVNKMSLRISFFYLLVQAHIARLPLEKSQIEQFLVSNRNARHGLDNEVLESL